MNTTNTINNCEDMSVTDKATFVHNTQRIINDFCKDTYEKKQRVDALLENMATALNSLEKHTENWQTIADFLKQNQQTRELVETKLGDIIAKLNCNTKSLENIKEIYETSERGLKETCQKLENIDVVENLQTQLKKIAHATQKDMVAHGIDLGMKLAKTNINFLKDMRKNSFILLFSFLNFTFCAIIRSYALLKKLRFDFLIFYILGSTLMTKVNNNVLYVVAFFVPPITLFLKGRITQAILNAVLYILVIIGAFTSDIDMLMGALFLNFVCVLWAVIVVLRDEIKESAQSSHKENEISLKNE